MKLVYLREQLKARVKFLYVKESSWFYLLTSTLVSQSLLQNMSRSNTANRSRQNTEHAVYRPCRLSLFFLALVCALNFDSLFFGSSYKIVFNIFKLIIYPPAAEAQYWTLDSTYLWFNTWCRRVKIIVNFLCWLPVTSFVINSKLSNIFNTILYLEQNICES